MFKFLFFTSFSLFVFNGCIQVKTNPIVVEPIYIEITINHKIQKELDSIFDQIDKASETLEYKSLEDSK